MLEVVMESMDIQSPLKSQAESSAEAPDTNHWLLEILGQEMLSIDEICSRSQKTVQEITVAITELELNGAVESSTYGYQRISLR